jgi:hypothetical protein
MMLVRQCILNPLNVALRWPVKRPVTQAASPPS